MSPPDDRSLMPQKTHATSRGAAASHLFRSPVSVSSSISFARFLGAGTWFYLSCGSHFPKVVLAPPTSPGFYPHSEWTALGPVQVGVRSKAQAHHNGDGPGLLGCCNLTGNLEG